MRAGHHRAKDGDHHGQRQLVAAAITWYEPQPKGTMTAEDLKRLIIEGLTRIAPEIDPASIASRASFRDQLDLDSMDFLNFVLALHDRLRIDIPEADYPHLSTLDGAIAYLAAKLDDKARVSSSPDAVRTR